MSTLAAIAAGMPTTAANEIDADAEAEEAAAAVVAERQWPVIVKLRKPVEFGRDTVTSLEFRRGKLGDLKGLNIDAIPPLDQLLLIASRMCGKPLKVIESLEDEDGAEVIAIALGFFARCLGGGKTAPQS
jgi:hypothetical protein